MKFERIRNMREDHDLTQKDVADLLGQRRSTYAMWELGDVEFPLLMLIKLKEYYKTNLDYLLGLSNDKRYLPLSTPLTKELIGEKLRLLRISKCLTQIEFGKPLSVNQSALSYYEYGRSQLSSQQLYKIATFYHISADEFCNLKKASKN